MGQNNSIDNDPNLFMGEASISVSLTSFMTAVLFFFIGLLLTGSTEMQVRLRVPLAFLFISAFGFLYSTLVYANASGEIARLRKHAFKRQMSIGNILSEYLGVYCLAFAIPITILGYSVDKILSILVLIISVSSFLLYHLFGYSIFERYVNKIGFYVILFVLTSLQISAFISFYFDEIIIYYIISLVLLVTIIILITYSLCKDEN